MTENSQFCNFFQVRKKFGETIFHFFFLFSIQILPHEEITRLINDTREEIELIEDINEKVNEIHSSCGVQENFMESQQQSLDQHQESLDRQEQSLEQQKQSLDQHQQSLDDQKREMVKNTFSLHIRT